MADNATLIDFEKARQNVLNVLAGKVTSPVAVRVIAAMQAAAVEVANGRWLPANYKPYKYSKCSECGRRTNAYEKTNYCPNCGVKMDW